MAGVAYVKIRLWNPGRANIFGDESNCLHGLKRATFHMGKNTNQKYIEILWISATQAGLEELGTAATTDLDGTTTPFLINVVSDDNTQDTVTGDAAQRVAVIGITVSSVGAYVAGEKPKQTVEVIDMAGTTDVYSVRYYLHTPHAYICSVGSEGDAKGTITIESPANTTLVTIAATNMESDGCKIYFAPDDYVKLDRVIISPVDALAAGDGGRLEITELGFEGRYHILEDFPTDQYAFIHYNGIVDIKEAWPIAKRATKYSSLLFSEDLIANTQTIKIHCTIIVHK